MDEKILIREYLSSLKEDTELDKIFVFLLESMGFEIISTPVESKGQSQYGKDIVAIGLAENGKKHSWYFELKGGDDANIDANKFNKPDGIRESLLEAKDVTYRFLETKGFEKLPTKFVLVHNGVLKENFKDQFNGFIKKTFSEGEFEHWDINKLTPLFYEKLFNEYLFTTEIRRNNLKRILIFLSLPDYDFNHLHILINDVLHEFVSNQKLGKRKVSLLFYSIGVLLRLIWSYSKEQGNHYHVKYAINYCILNTWQSILITKKTNNKAVLGLFSKLLNIQYEFYGNYFVNSFELARLKNGIASQIGSTFESIAFPLKTYQYLDDLVYYFTLKNQIDGFRNLTENQNIQKDLIHEIFNSNEGGGHKIILDSQLIQIHHIFKFMLNSKQLRLSDVNFLLKFIGIIIDQIYLRKLRKNSFPYNSKNLEQLIEFEATGFKGDTYPEGESQLIAMLYEYFAIFNQTAIFEDLTEFTKEVDLQIAEPLWEEIPDFEQRYFGGYLSEEYCIDLIDNPTDFNEFRSNVKTKYVQKDNFITNKIYPFLTTLAQSFYQNEPDPNEWRDWFRKIKIE